MKIGSKTFSDVPLPPIPHASTEEKLIVGKMVRDILAAGLTITIWNGGDEPELEWSTDEAAIFAALGASGHDEIVARTVAGKRVGWVMLVWGNDCAVISDYTTHFEAVLEGANKLADELDEQ